MYYSTFLIPTQESDKQYCYHKVKKQQIARYTAEISEIR